MISSLEDTIMVKNTPEFKSRCLSSLEESPLFAVAKSWGELVSYIHDSISLHKKRDIYGLVKLEEFTVILLPIHRMYPISETFAKNISSAGQTSVLLLLQVPIASFYGFALYDRGILKRKIISSKGKILEQIGQPQEFERHAGKSLESVDLSYAIDAFGLSLQELHWEGKYSVIDGNNLKGEWIPPRPHKPSVQNK